MILLLNSTQIQQVLGAIFRAGSCDIFAIKLGRARRWKTVLNLVEGEGGAAILFSEGDGVSRSYIILYRFPETKPRATKLLGRSQGAWRCGFAPPLRLVRIPSFCILCAASSSRGRV